MKNTGLTDLDIKFCQEVAKGNTSILDCVRTAYPKYKSAKKETAQAQGNRLIKRKEIQDKVMEIRKKQEEKTADKYGNLKEEMIDRMVRGIRKGSDGDELTIVEFSKLIDILAKMNAWYAPTDVTLRNGGVSADYRPPTLLSMSDEEITERLKELRDK